MENGERLDRAIERLLARFKGSGVSQTDEFKELADAYAEQRDPGDLASS